MPRLAAKQQKPASDVQVFAPVGVPEQDNSLMVILRGPSAKHLWDGLERLGEQLGDLVLEL